VNNSRADSVGVRIVRAIVRRQNVRVKVVKTFPQSGVNGPALEQMSQALRENRRQLTRTRTLVQELQACFRPEGAPRNYAPRRAPRRER